MTEQQLRDECAKLAAEWNLAGFANGAIYEDFAVELAKRAVMAERNRCVRHLRDTAERLAHGRFQPISEAMTRRANALAIGDQPKTLAKK